MPVSKFNLTFLHNEEQLSVIIETPIDPTPVFGPSGATTFAEDFDAPKRVIDRLARVAKALLPDGPVFFAQGFEPMHMGDPEAHPKEEEEPPSRGDEQFDDDL